MGEKSPNPIMRDWEEKLDKQLINEKPLEFDKKMWEKIEKS